VGFGKTRTGAESVKSEVESSAVIARDADGKAALVFRPEISLGVVAASSQVRRRGPTPKTNGEAPNLARNRLTPANPPSPTHLNPSEYVSRWRREDERKSRRCAEL